VTALAIAPLPTADQSSVLCACGCGEPTNAKDLKARRLRAQGWKLIDIARDWECSTAWVKVLLRRDPPRWIKGHTGYVRSTDAVEVACARCGKTMRRTPNPKIKNWYCQRRECMTNAGVASWVAISKVVDANLAEQRRWVTADPDGRIRYAEAARRWQRRRREFLAEKELGSPLYREFARGRRESRDQWIDYLALLDSELGALIREQRKDHDMRNVGFKWVYSLDAARYPYSGDSTPVTLGELTSDGDGETEWQDPTFDVVCERLDREREEHLADLAALNRAVFMDGLDFDGSDDRAAATCKDKVRYTTQSAASRALGRQTWEGRVYRCDSCGRFHLTSRSGWTAKRKPWMSLAQENVHAAGSGTMEGMAPSRRTRAAASALTRGTRPEQKPRSKR
jgi:hypothetical protein